MSSLSIVATTVYTIIATDENGEKHDLNATGERIDSVSGLAFFIGELTEVNAISDEQAAQLLLELAEI